MRVSCARCCLRFETQIDKDHILMRCGVGEGVVHLTLFAAHSARRAYVHARGRLKCEIACAREIIDAEKRENTHQMKCARAAKNPQHANESSVTFSALSRRLPVVSKTRQNKKKNWCAIDTYFVEFQSH
jgi:translation elongation factor EF-Ts